jgi:DNA-binding MarR family transcriptional regulator
MDEANALYNVLKEIFLLLDDGDRHLLADFNLTVPRFYALFHLGAHPGLSVSELSDLMFCDKSNVTRLVQGLEVENLVRRRRHESDGRVHRLFLTSEGEALRRQALAIHSKHNEQRFDSPLGSRERATLLSSLEKVKSTLQVNLQEFRTLL